MQGIYKITNKQTGETYIGQSNNCERRLQEHKQIRSLTIDDWINFLGVDAFTYEIIEECETNELDVREQYFIELYDSINNGYNHQQGGYNNSIGEGNGRSRLTEEDVKQIRIAYNNHCSPKEEYEQKYKDKISYSQFQGIWQGRSWSHVMPEVFTEQNKQFYRSGLQQRTASLTCDEVLKYRQFYVNHTIKETYQLMTQEKGLDFLKENTFRKIINGDVRENSIYKSIPVYKKQAKKWI